MKAKLALTTFTQAQEQRSEQKAACPMTGHRYWFRKGGSYTNKLYHQDNTTKINQIRSLIVFT